MGVVRKQSIRSSILIYLGFALGAFNFWLLPNILSGDEFGLVRVLISVSTLLAGLCSLGTLPVITRFFPYYQAGEKKHTNDLLGWVLAISIVGYIIMVSLTFGFKDLIVRKFQGNSPLFINYFYLIYPFTFFILLYGIYERIAWSREFSVISNLMRETGVRFYTLIIAGMLFLNWLNYHQFITWYSFQFGFAFLVLLIFLKYKQGTHLTWRISNTTKRLYKEMRVYSAYIFGVSLFTLVEQYFNTILLSSRISLTTAGIFDIAFFIATFLTIPKRSMQAAASATIATAWKDNDTKKIDRVYQKSAATLLIAGMAILSLIWLNIDHIFDLYNKPQFRSGKYVVLVVGIANLIDLGTGLNYDILVNSKLWKLHFIISVGLVAFFLPVTYLFVVEYGMMGSAYGILASLAAYNLARCYLMWWKFRMQPFSVKTIFIVLAGLIAYFVPAYLIPEFSNIFIDGAIKSIAFLIIFAIGIIGGKLSEDVNDLYKLMLAKLGLKR